MKANIKCIGIIDQNNKVHRVEFDEGVNIITGKSSTGKSAIIEIFDYSFGSSDFTIPHGVITSNAKMYFVVIRLENTELILCRGIESEMNHAYIKEFDNVDTNKLNIDWFEEGEDYFIPLAKFKLLLGEYFGLNFENTTEDKELAEEKSNKPRPTVRNYTSYMLQHQNLIANKHALFYRFDEKKKRETCIDEFKIYAGFVDQNYYILKQNLNELKSRLRVAERLEKRNNVEKDLYKKKILNQLLQYKIVTGNDLFSGEYNVNDFLSPKKQLELIQEKLKDEVDISYESNEHLKARKEIIKKLSEIETRKRKMINKLQRVDFALNNSKEYENELIEHTHTDEECLPISCPICNSKNSNDIDFVNRLSDAYKWLNKELKKTAYLTQNFEITRNNLLASIKECDVQIKEYAKQLNEIDSIISKLDNEISLRIQGQIELVSIAGLLENLLKIMREEKDNDKDSIQKEINKTLTELKENYNITSKMKNAENIINKYMNMIANNLDFEDSYKPLNLRFDLGTFDLYNYKDGKKVYLRSMGSGANWLYSHVCVFLAIQYYLCKNKNSTIPPILFLDQPSQVYFPATPLDKTWEETIDKAKNVKEVEIDERIAKAETDEDLKAVTNLYNVIVEHCNYTKKETGIMPQIIITDHADNLELKDAVFEDLVNGRRWRKRGLIGK